MTTETICFEAESCTVSTGRHTSNLSIELEAVARNVAEALCVEDRLYNMDMRDIIDEVGATKLLDAFDTQEISTWVQDTQTDSYLDLLNAIGLDAIHEYLSHIN
jgi:acetylglutamate kinase